MYQNRKICRTCLCVGDTTFLSVDAIVPNSDLIPIKEKISACVPELGLDIVPDAVICAICLNALHTAFSFKKKCRKTEERIQDYIYSRQCSFNKVDLRKIVDPVDTSVDNDLSEEEPNDLRMNLKKYSSGQQIQIINLSTKKLEVKSEAVESPDVDISVIKVEPIDYTSGSNETSSNSATEINTNMMFSSFTNNKPYKCTLCEKAYRREIGLFAHMRMHQENPVKHFSKQMNLTTCLPSEIKQFLPKQSDSIDAVCEICQKTFYSKSNLTVHMRIHTGEKPYRCKICTKAFTQKVYLTAHERTHTGEKPFKCSLCNKSFAQKSYLRTHMIVHTGVRHHICKVCGKGCAHTGDLNNHMRIHTGEKPYRCKDCGKCFTQSVHLKSHVKIHSGEKPFECHVCHAKYTESRYLKKHMRIHLAEKPYRCGICSQSFHERYVFIEHLKSHAEEKYVCTVCNKSFSNSSHLDEHMEIHRADNQTLNAYLKKYTGFNIESCLSVVKSEPELESSGSELSTCNAGQNDQEEFKGDPNRFFNKADGFRKLWDEISGSKQEDALILHSAKYFVNENLQQNALLNSFIKAEPCILENSDAY